MSISDRSLILMGFLDTPGTARPASCTCSACRTSGLFFQAAPSAR